MHVCLCVCVRDSVRECVMRAGAYACSYLWLSVCVITSLKRQLHAGFLNAEKLLCDDYQVAHVFPTSFPPSFLLSVLYSPLSLMFAFSPLICDCMWVVFSRASVVLFTSQLPVLILPYEIYTISLSFFFFFSMTALHSPWTQNRKCFQLSSCKIRCTCNSLPCIRSWERVEVGVEDRSEISWQARWKVSGTLWIYFTDPSGKTPIESFGKGRQNSGRGDWTNL